MKAILITTAFLALNLYALPTPPAGHDLIPLAQAYFELFSGSQTRDAELLPFGDQSEAMGYVPGETFRVPASLKSRVEFWKKIYSEYTTHQAVFHDSDFPQLIYSVVDLEPAGSPFEVNYRGRHKRMNSILESEHRKIEDELKKLHEYVDHPSEIPAELKALYKEFDGIPGGKDRFLLAVGRIRSQIGQRDRIVRGFFYGGRYFNQMMDIFATHHLPKELTRLPLVESAFNPSARSKVGASGIWQFMRSTGRLFLHINRAVDERNDPLSATVAAADLLQGNYEALGSWPLALTAYNHGRGGMLRAVRETGTTDLAEIIRNYRGPAFGFASSNFYSEFLAILELERDYRKHFGKLMVDEPIDFEGFPIADNVRFPHLATACGMDRDELAELNPGLTDWVLSGHGYVPRGFQLRVAPGHSTRCLHGYPMLAKLDLRPGRRHSARVRVARARVRKRRRGRASRHA